MFFRKRLTTRRLMIAIAVTAMVLSRCTWIDTYPVRGVWFTAGPVELSAFAQGGAYSHRAAMFSWRASPVLILARESDGRIVVQTGDPMADHGRGAKQWTLVGRSDSD